MEIVSINSVSMKRKFQQRKNWIRLDEESGNAGFVCRRCGISRPTLRKWWRRYSERGESGLYSLSRRPHRFPNRKVSDHDESLTLDLRHSRNLGARRIKSELQRLHSISLSLATIHKILTKHQVKPVKNIRKRADFKRYERPIPGDRVQMDTCKIGPGLNQYTSIYDCTRYRVLRIYKLRTAAITMDFIDCVFAEMSFPVQRIHIDRGREFFAVQVQEKLMALGIKFRPNRPGSPHLNGKVERSRQTDKSEFHATIKIDSENVDDLLAEWQHYYNWNRPHSAHNGRSPMERYFELCEETPFSDEVAELYQPSKEHIRNANYKVDLKLARLKRSL